MTRRTDLLNQLLASDKFGEEKEQEKRFLTATAELILTDLISIAINGFTKRGAGTLMINLQNDSTVYVNGDDIEADIIAAESAEDDDVKDFLLGVLQRVNDNDWTKYVLITLIAEHGTRTFNLEAGGSQESFHEAAARAE